MAAYSSRQSVGVPVARPPANEQVLQGTLDLLILKTLSLAPMHGWGLTHRIEQLSREALQVGQGSIYPALVRLEQRGWISTDWGVTENNRRAKYYQLTAAGTTLGIGIGAAVGVGAIVYGVLLRPLPYPDSDALVRVSLATPGIPGSGEDLSGPVVQHFAESARSLDGIGGYYVNAGINIT